MQYTKPPIDISAQIATLKARGLIFRNEHKAAHYLSNISYYRLRAYTYPFQDNSDPNHPFVKHVSFEQVIDLYVFDRRLRILVFDALEKVEIALRTKIIYEFALGNGSHWHEDANLYRNHTRFARDISKLYEEVNRSNETFIDHYKRTYTQPPEPPAWMSLEVASLGLLSKIFENLRRGGEKTRITRAFGITRPEILESWMHTFATLRNICAHHGRLWNRRLPIIPQLPYNTLYTFVNTNGLHPNKLYATLCCITYVLHIISPGNDFNARLTKLIYECPLVDIKEMGFPKNWASEQLWKS